MVPSFFVILLNPSALHLPLPPDVVSRHLENKIREGPVIVSANGGYWWRLKIKQINGSYCFANGWRNVVQDIKLGHGDFLYFKPLDQCTLRMSIHNPNGCERVLPPKVENVIEVDDQGEGGDDPYFTFIITKTYTNMLLAGMEAEGTMVMKNVDEEEWQVSLRVEISHDTKRYYLATGWGAFQRENDLSEGDECVIKFVRSEGKLLLTKITEQPQPFGPGSEVVKRKRGRSQGSHKVYRQAGLSGSVHSTVEGCTSSHNHQSVI
ncbi:putative transcription factor B3-Domain family [Helianthus anomalus]